MIYIYPLWILTLADCLLDSGPHSSIFYVWSILRYVPDHNYIFFTALYYWREWYDVHWRGHQISVEKSIRISSCFTCLRKIVDYLLSDQKDSRVCNNFDLPKYLGGKHSLFFNDFFELRKCLCFPFCLLRNTKYSITSIQNYISTYVSEYNINTEENMEEEMTLVNTIWCIGGCKKRQSLLQAPCAK